MPTVSKHQIRKVGATLIALLIAVALLSTKPAAQVITWGAYLSTAGGTLTGSLLGIDGTAAAPSFYYASDTLGNRSGMYKCTTNYNCIAAGSLGVVAFNNDGGSTYGLRARSDAQIGFSSTTSLTASNDTQFTRGGVGLMRVGNGTHGIEFNTGAVTVASCGTGAASATSTASAGDVTATGATACTVNFTTSFSNQPECTISEVTSAVAARISAIAAGSFTVSGLTSGDRFLYHCTGVF